MLADRLEKLVVSVAETAGTVLLNVDGILDSTTYLPLRDQIIKAALDEPRAVVIDVSPLTVPSPSAWAVFTSARWHVEMWPDVPILLVCSHPEGRKSIERNGITRYVPVYPSTAEAIEASSAWLDQPTATHLEFFGAHARQLGSLGGRSLPNLAVVRPARHRGGDSRRP